MAKRKTTVPPDEQDLEGLNGEAMPTEETAGAEDLERDGEALPPAPEDNPSSRDAFHEDAVESGTDEGALDDAGTLEGMESPLPSENDQAAEDDGYNDILQELGDAVAEAQTPLKLEQSGVDVQSDEGQFSEDDLMLLSEGDEAPAAEPDAVVEQPPQPTPSDPRRSRVLTIDARGEIQTEAEREATIWHEIQNSYRTRRILTGSLDGVEKTESGLTLAVVNYKGFRVAIPVKEMMLHTGKMPSGREFTELMDRLHRILNSRLGSEIDFVVKGYDNTTHSVVASRRDAMLRKRQTFYMDTDELGEHMIYEGRVVQARVVAVAEKVIRVEVFGVECSIVARGLSWEWIGNAREHFSVGDRKNEAFSGIIIHKIDSVTGEGIYDVKFLLYDANKNPIGEYSTDQNGYIYIDDALAEGKGRFYIRELEAAEGYELDKEYKTVYVQPGKTIEIEWENTPITGQIQIYKYAAEYNEVTGTPAGTPLQGAVYEISNARTGAVVDYITTDARGVAASKPLPLTRYKIVEVTAPAYWQVDPTIHDVTLEYSGQIIKLSAYDKPSNLGVTITKRGNAEVLAGQTMRYDLTVANTSNVPLENFYWHERALFLDNLRRNTQ